MPASVAEVVSDFADVTGRDKLALLLEFANELPPASQGPRGGVAMEPVAGMPVAAVPARHAADPDHVRLHFSGAPEAPDHLRFRLDPGHRPDGQSAAVSLAVPDDFYADPGLAALISPLRLRGMAAMLTRISTGCAGG